jgi:hypothetical protein
MFGIKREVRCKSGAIPVAVNDMPKTSKRFKENFNLQATVLNGKALKFSHEPEDLPDITYSSLSFRVKGRRDIQYFFISFSGIACIAFGEFIF